MRQKKSSYDAYVDRVYWEGFCTGVGLTAAVAILSYILVVGIQ